MKYQQRPNQISLFEFEESINNSSIRILYKKKEIGQVSKESLILLHKEYEQDRLKKEMNYIESGRRDDISYTEIKKIFGEMWFLIFVDPEKIKKDFKRIESNNTFLLTNNRGSTGVKKMTILSEWYEKNIEDSKIADLPKMTENIEKDIQAIKSFLDFDLDKYRERKVDNLRYKYLIDKIDSKNIYVFRAYNYPDILPIKINGTDFEGMTVSLENGERALILAQRFDFIRKITTLIALLYSTMQLTSEDKKTTEDNYFEITKEHYEFVGNFLLKKEEIIQMQKDIEDYPGLQTVSNEYGISSQYLLKFLFEDFDKNRFLKIQKQIPKKETEGDGGLRLNYKKRFTHHYSPTLLIQKTDKIKKDLSFVKRYARQMITKGNTLKDKAKFLMEIINNYL